MNRRTAIKALVLAGTSSALAQVPPWRNRWVSASQSLNPAGVPGKSFWLDARSISLADGAEIEIWNDTSGNGNNATSTTRRPVFVSSTPEANNQKSVNFTGPSYPTQRLLTASIPFPAEFTMFYVLNGSSGAMLSSANHLHVIYPSGKKVTNWSNVGTLFCPIRSGWVVRTYQISNGVELFRENGIQSGSYTASRAGSTATAYIGSQDANAAFSYSGSMAQVLIFDHVLTDEQTQGIESYFADLYGITLGQASAPIRVCIDGDSISHMNEPTDSWPIRLQAGLGSGYDVTNFAVDGQTIPMMAADNAVQVLPYGFSGRNIYIGWEYINSSGDGVTLFNQIKSLYLANKAAGYRTIACTDFHIARKATSDLVRSNWTDFADGLAELDLQSLRADSATYGDNIHLTSAGWQIVADVVQGVIESL